MSLTWQGYVVLAAVVLGIVFSYAKGLAGDAEASRLAGLGACGLATHYLEWQFAFVESLGSAPTIRGEALDTFVRHNATYAKAAGSARATSNAVVLARLEAAARHDANRRNETVSDPRPFYEAYWDDCPVQATALANRTR